MSDVECVSCSAPISPAFKAALRDNICPGCGDSIFTKDAQELMEELKDAMEEMPNDPQGLAGWLMSNYRMGKGGDGEPTGFYGVPPAGEAATGTGREESGDLKIAPNRMQQFFKNAGVKPKDMSALTNQIQSAGGHEAVDMEVGDDEEVPDESNYPEFTKAALAGMMPEGQQMSQQQKTALMNGMSQQQNNVEGEDDLHPALHEDRRSRLAKQQELTYGGTVGKISRRS